MEVEKTIEDYFYDWENHVFGYGYGTGEKHTLSALQKFLSLVPESGCYNYIDIEKSLGETVTWLLINILCRADVIEYGCSPRFGWLTERGVLIKDYLKDKRLDDIFDKYDENYIICYPEVCNCVAKCNNPFFNSELLTIWAKLN